MNRSFSVSAQTFIHNHQVARSNLVRGHAGQVWAGGRSSYSRLWPDGLVPTTIAERRAHFRVSFRRSLAVVAITVVVLCGSAVLIAACASL